MRGLCLCQTFIDEVSESHPPPRSPVNSLRSLDSFLLKRLGRTFVAPRRSALTLIALVGDDVSAFRTTPATTYEGEKYKIKLLFLHRLRKMMGITQH